MENQNNKANAFQHKRQPQDTNFQGQTQRVFAALYTTNPELFPIVEPSKPKGNE